MFAFGRVSTFCFNGEITLPPLPKERPATKTCMVPHSLAGSNRRELNVAEEVSSGASGG